MRRAAVWSAALVVILIMAGVALYSAVAATGAPRAATFHSQVSPTFSPPPGGISRDQAVAIARQQMGAGQVTLESAVAGRFATFAGGVVGGSSPDRLIWAVTFGGVFVDPCPAGVTCEPKHHATVVLDYFVGTILFTVDKP
jgi:hypothetical protein